MRWKKEILTTAGLLLASGNLLAVPATQLKENYQSIIERNPFGLKAPSPVATNIAPPEVKPKVEVFLTGVTSIGYPKLPKQAYFYTREQGKKDIVYYAMTEGTGKDGIQVLNIDHEKRKVRIKMDNAETVLSFETHGVPVQAVAGRPGVPGAPGSLPMPGQLQPGVQPLPMPGAPPNASVSYDANGQPVYNNAAGVMPQPVNSVNPVNTTMNTGSTGLRQIPSRRIRGGNQYGSVPTPPPMNQVADAVAQQPQVDPAEEYVKAQLINAAQRQEQQQQPSAIPLPPLPTIE
jgi:hypothetical protein